MTIALHYSLIRELFPSLLGFIYFFVFFPFTRQMLGLFGSQGILPITEYLEWMEKRYKTRRFYHVPTLFWVSASDRTLKLFPWIATFLSLLLLMNIAPLFLIPLLLMMHLSLISTGQDFLSFGWEMFTIEIAFNSWLWLLFPVPHPMIFFSLNLLLFRFHFEAGISKLLSRDQNWRSLSAIAFHYESQPLPNTESYYAFRLPPFFQKFSCAMMFFVELIVPFFIFGNDEWRIIAWIFLVMLQVFIWLTGNFSYLNYLTVLFCMILLPDSLLEIFFSPPSLPATNGLFLDLCGWMVGTLLTALQIARLYNHLFPLPFFQKIFYLIQPYHFCNRYGIFAIMTTERIEIVFEGSNDGEVWKEYLFKYKPSEISRRPRRIAPFQPRLDWQAWFLPFSSFYEEVWVQNFATRLLQGSPDVLQLLRKNPFHEKPPRYLRMKQYLYHFTTPQEKALSGNWWKRVEIGNYSPTLSLKA